MTLKALMGAVALMGLSTASWAQVPDYYPADYQKIIDAAKAEGKLVLYSPLGNSDVKPFIAGFEKLYPGIKVEPNDLNTLVLYNRFISEAAGGAATADIIWSSASDLQAKLISDGYAVQYVSPEIPKLPKWAYWDKGGYGTNFEPYMFIYNNKALKPDQVPKTHTDVPKFLRDNSALLNGKVAAYNVETSGNGFLSTTRDAEFATDFWELPKALGDVNVRLYSSTGDMIESVGSSENLFGYNQPGYFAVNAAKKNPNVTAILPDDFVTVLTRIAFIPKAGKNQNAAKLFLDYLLSKSGQQIVADVGFFSLRPDVEGPYTLAKLQAERGDKIRPPQLGPELLFYLDQKNRLDFLNKWKAAMRD